jgi:hypothetical protein
MFATALLLIYLLDLVLQRAFAPRRPQAQQTTP